MHESETWADRQSAATLGWYSLAVDELSELIACVAPFVMACGTIRYDTIYLRAPKSWRTANL